MNIIISGYGEIGEAVWEIEYSAGHTCAVHDPPKGLILGKWFGVNVVHICLPYSNEFVGVVANQIKTWEPGLTIIHSTVTAGTTAAIAKATGLPVVHSPVRGTHPNLKEGILTFKKFVGGEPKAVKRVVKYLTSIGIPAEAAGNSETTELMKILSTTYYGTCILYTQLCKDLCDAHGADFDMAYTEANHTYNVGHKTLGRPEVARPVLTPPGGKIGGHCVSQNFDLLPEGPWKEFLRGQNDGNKE